LIIDDAKGRKVRVHDVDLKMIRVFRSYEYHPSSPNVGAMETVLGVGDAAVGYGWDWYDWRDFVGLELGYFPRGA